MIPTIDQTIDTVRLRTIASHERVNAALVHTVEALRDAMRGQDAEVQRLRAENARLMDLLQAKDALIDALEESNLSLDDTCERQMNLLKARYATPPLLADAIQHLDVGDRYLAGQSLMEFAESELKRSRSEYGPEIVAITSRMIESLSGDTGAEQ